MRDVDDKEPGQNFMALHLSSLTQSVIGGTRRLSLGATDVISYRAAVGVSASDVGRSFIR